MYVDFFEFLRKNKGYCFAFAVIAVICITGAWIVCDHYRNAAINDSTDGTVERIESGIESAGELIAGSQRRVEEAEETVSAVTERVDRSTAVAKEISGGIEACERKLDECIQRSGRIKNIMQNIEEENRKRTAGTTAANLAK